MRKNLFKHIIFFSLSLFSTYPVLAIYLDSAVTVMPYNQEFISKQVVNDTGTTNVYLINLYQIDRPGKDEKALAIENGEVLYTPLRMVIEPNKWEFFKIFYTGEQDEKERYYRLIIQEIPINAIKITDQNQQSIISSIISFDTFLVIEPRKRKFDYLYQADTGTLTNTGNTFFKVIVHQGCDGDEEAAHIFNLLPDETYTHDELRQNNKKFINTNNTYIRLGKQCF